MAAPKGNKNALGKETGRKSTYQEKQDAIWHDEKWRIDSDVLELQSKLATKKYSVRDVFLAKALQGNEKILAIFANKLLADLVDVRGKDGQELKSGFLFYPSKKDINDIESEQK